MFLIPSRFAQVAISIEILIDISTLLIEELTGDYGWSRIALRTATRAQPTVACSSQKRSGSLESDSREAPTPQAAAEAVDTGMTVTTMAPNQGRLSSRMGWRAALEM